MSRHTLVTGAGGFIGGHLTRFLLDHGHHVVALDIKPRAEWWQVHDHRNVTNLFATDAGSPNAFVSELNAADDVYHLAENMGGIGFIERNLVACANSVTTSVHLLNAVQPHQRFFFSSSACVYPQHLQSSATDVVPLRESDAYPADPEPGYGWQKLYVEELCKYHAIERGLDTRVARFHNSYGPHGAWIGGREKAPAAICRKVAYAKLTGEYDITIWGDGEQRRSFMYVEDNVDGIYALMNTPVVKAIGPINIGSAETVSINDLVSLIEKIAFDADGILHRTYDITAPRGVLGRTSDNTFIKSFLNWEPTTALIDGLRATYPWIEKQVRGKLYPDDKE